MQNKPDKLLRLRAVLSLTGLSRSSLYRAISRPESAGGGFPRPAKLYGIAVWPESEVSAWIERRKADREAA